MGAAPMQWGLLLRLGLLNLGRNPKRSALTAVAVVAGVALMILGFGFVDGFDENILRTQINTQSGHVMLRAPGLDAGSRPPGHRPTRRTRPRRGGRTGCDDWARPEAIRARGPRPRRSSGR